MRRLALAAVALALCGGWLIGKPVPVPSYTGPGDYVSFTAWYGLRAYSAAAAAAEVNALDLRRVSDNATCTAKIGTDGAIDLTVGTPCNGATQTVTAWIGASTARVSKMYDQTSGTACGGSTCDVVQATANNQPLLVLTGCSGAALPCLYSDTSTVKSMSSAANFTPTTAVMSFTAVFSYHPITGTPNAHSIKAGGGTAGAGVVNSLHGYTTATNRCIGGAAATLCAAATDDVWHGAIAVNNGASSLIAIDGTAGTGTQAGGTTASPVVAASNSQQLGVETSRQYFAEGGFTDNSAWSSGVRTALCHNQRIYWGLGGSC